MGLVVYLSTTKFHLIAQCSVQVLRVIVVMSSSLPCFFQDPVRELQMTTGFPGFRTHLQQVTYCVQVCSSSQLYATESRFLYQPTVVKTSQCAYYWSQNLTRNSSLLYYPEDNQRVNAAVANRGESVQWPGLYILVTVCSMYHLYDLYRNG